jgi:alpha,alpha-trehalase
MRLVGQRSALAAFLILSISLPGSAGGPSTASPPAPPSVEFGELYRAVQMAGLFDDQKTFADAIPDEAPDKVMAEYETEKQQPGFDLKAFVDRHFTKPRHFDGVAQRENRSVGQYISAMWDALQRKPDETEPFSSLLPLSRPYVVPGGRFTEIYYWDSYFTMLGLEQDGRRALARDMLENIASLIDLYGHMPNGNRSYYLSRSQPPFFSLMVELVAANDGDRVLIDHLPELQSEYDFWMDGVDRLAPGAAHRRVVRLDDGAVLNRYWDDRDEPRDESYRQDVETARRTNRAPAEVYRDLRAGAESGWDFSSRWLADGIDLRTIRTTEIAPVDLNALIKHLEETLGRAYRLKGDEAAANRYQALADRRSAAMRRLMWSAGQGFFVDYLWRDQRQSDALSAATIFPLYFGVATTDEAHLMAAALKEKLLEPGGLGTTAQGTGQQWDRPNGWAPLQYLAIEGLNAYGERDLAREIAARWLAKNFQGYAATGVLVEKYNVDEAPDQKSGAGGGGGEYALQIGFGWTNGVLAKLMAEYPDLAAKSTPQNP